jgi:glutamine synthetase
MANPYLYLASQIHAGLDGVQRSLPLPHEHEPNSPELPANMSDALSALQSSSALSQGFGEQVIAWFTHIKRQEIARFDAATDKTDWLRREYFSRF